MPATYEHTQVGHVTIAAVTAGVVVAVVAAVVARHAVPAIVAVLLLILLSQLATLTTSVADGVLEVRMGTGLFRRRIALKDVERVAVIRHLWVWGWGIRWTPFGWQWNVSGTRGVELTYRSGRRFRIGSDEPEALASAIASWLERGAHVDV